MSETILMTQALDERDLLRKKIRQKIVGTFFIDYRKNNEENVIWRACSREEFRKEAESAYQSIIDNIRRYERLDAAIIASNANAKITTSYGEYTVAAAIALRSRLQAGDPVRDIGDDFDTYTNNDFEAELSGRMYQQYNDAVRAMDSKNASLEQTAETMRLSILGKDGRGREDGPALEVVKTYVAENKAGLEDPLDIRKKVDALRQRHDTLLSELDTGIKVSNATTFITF